MILKSAMKSSVLSTTGSGSRRASPGERLPEVRGRSPGGGAGERLRRAGRRGERLREDARDLLPRPSRGTSGRKQKWRRAETSLCERDDIARSEEEKIIDGFIPLPHRDERTTAMTVAAMKPCDLLRTKMHDEATGQFIFDPSAHSIGCAEFAVGNSGFSEWALDSRPLKCGKIFPIERAQASIS